MTYHIEWDHTEPSLLRVVVSAPLSWDAFNSALADIYREVEAHAGPAFVVGEILQDDNPLPMGGWRDPLYFAYRNRPANLQKWIIVGASPSLRVTLHLFMQLYGLLARPPIVFTPSLHAARQMVRRLLVASSA